MAEATARTVLVTGASSGIGWGTTRVLTKKGVHVFATVRKAADAQRLTESFAERVTPLLLDVTDEDAVNGAAEQVRVALHDQTLWGLVNNAGVSSAEGPLLHLDTEGFRQQLEVNLVAVHNVVRAFGPLLGADKSLAGGPGRIVNISSVGGKNGGPFLGAYVASKHGLEGYSETLRRELMLYGIDVIIVGPGSVNTAIWDKAEANDTSAFDGTDYGSSVRNFKQYLISEGRKGLGPEAVGKTVWRALTARRPNVRYAPVPNKLMNWTLPMLLPRRVVDRMIARGTGLVAK